MQLCRYVYDDNGNSYLDFYGGHAVISIGHSHPYLVKCMYWLRGASISNSYWPGCSLPMTGARLGGKKYRSEARMVFFQPTSPTGPPCTVSGKGRYLM